MRNEIYELRPQRIIARLQQLLGPLHYTFAFNKQGLLFSIKRGTNSKPCPYFYKDRRGKIFMKFKHNSEVVNKCIDYETDEWLAYYVYRSIISE